MCAIESQSHRAVIRALSCTSFSGRMGVSLNLAAVRLAARTCRHVPPPGGHESRAYQIKHGVSRSIDSYSQLSGFKPRRRLELVSQKMWRQTALTAWLVFWNVGSCSMLCLLIGLTVTTLVSLRQLLCVPSLRRKTRPAGTDHWAVHSLRKFTCCLEFAPLPRGAHPPAMIPFAASIEIGGGAGRM